MDEKVLAKLEVTDTEFKDRVVELNIESKDVSLVETLACIMEFCQKQIYNAIAHEEMLEKDRILIEEAARASGQFSKSISDKLG